MKKIYIVIEETIKGNHFAYSRSVETGTNLKNILGDMVDVAHLCETKKEADELAEHWNACYKANRTYMF